MSERDDELHLLSGAYALDAVDEVERAEFEAYLSTSEQARAEATSLSDTSAMLGLAAAPESPSAALRSRLMAQVAVAAQLPADDGIIRPSAATAAGAKARSRWYARPVTILVAAAAAVLLFLGGTLFGSVTSNGNEQRQAADVAQISAAKDVQRAEAVVKGGGTATLIWSLELRRSAVLVESLPRLPSGKTYELWYMDAAGAAKPAGTFSIAGSSTVVHVLAGRMSAGDTVGITVEPSGGSAAPTTVPITTIPSA